MIFTNLERSELSGSPYSEPIFSYLNRSARPNTQKVRNLLETWFSQYPETEKKELLPRIQSSDNTVFLSGFFELFIYALLCKMGYEIKVHPEISSDLLKSPDFLVRNDIEDFYLEAVVTNEISEKERVGQQILNLAMDKINEIESEDFFAHISIRGIASKPIQSHDLKKDISDWFQTLDHAYLFPIYQSKGLDGMPYRFYQYEGISLKIMPIPKNLHKGKAEKLIGSHTYGVRQVNTANAIRKAIKRKTRRYGKLDKPYVLAVNVLSMSCDNIDVMEALFGSERYTINIDSITNDIPRFSRDNDGMWSKHYGTRLSGVLLFRYLTPWTLSYQNTTLCLNPWTVFPYRGNLFQFNHAQINDNLKYQWTVGVEPQKILELPKDWPENIEE